jgi:hypothetical protein
MKKLLLISSLLLIGCGPDLDVLTKQERFRYLLCVKFQDVNELSDQECYDIVISPETVEYRKANTDERIRLEKEKRKKEIQELLDIIKE